MSPLSDRASPWPKFDKAVSELHDWLNTLSEMMKGEKVILGDSEDMEGLLEKQKVFFTFCVFFVRYLSSSLVILGAMQY